MQVIGVMVQADALFKDLTQFYGVPGANAGKKNGMYKHGRWGIKKKKTKCANCGATTNLLHHHIDHNEKNNKPSNIRVLCKRCHERHHERGYNFNRKQAPNHSRKRAPNGRDYR